MIKIDVKDTPHFQTKLKQVVLPLLMNLLSSKESESKAGGLNILGSFCGLSYDFQKVDISRNLVFFMRNSDFVSFQIWQLVFDLQEDWDITIKEASVVLIQLCAPREAVKYFNKVKQEKETLQINQMLSAQSRGGSSQSNQASEKHRFNDANMNSFFSGNDLSMITDNRPSDINPMLLDSELPDNSLTQQRFAAIQEINESGTIQNEENDQNEPFDFFVDKYQDEQIQEIISIFRNDFKPPNNLWIEKATSNNNGADYFNEIYSNAVEQVQQQQQLHYQQQNDQIQQKVEAGKVKQLDSLEDTLVDQLSANSHKKQEQLFERDEDAERELVSKTSKEEDKVIQTAIAAGNIDAEPYQFLDMKQASKEESKELLKTPAIEAEEDDELMQPPQPEMITQQKQEIDKEMKIFEEEVMKEPEEDKAKRTADELIDEYEKKIHETIQRLEEEKQKHKKEDQVNTIESKQTPEFTQKNKKVKKDLSPHELELNHEVPQMGGPTKITKKGQQAYLNDLSRGFISSLDNKNLVKQINQCFPQESTRSNNHANKKLNKSLENLYSSSMKTNLLKQELNRSQPKKNMSSSPRKNSKKANSKSGQKKKGPTPQLNQSVTSGNQNKALHNMRDLNFFIKTIEKDLSEKFNKLTMKDFNSMPTTPTSILKKVEDQVKELAKQNNQNNVKAQMANTCPNISHILRQLDIQNKEELSPKSKPLNLKVPHTNRSNIEKEFKNFASQGQTPTSIPGQSNLESFSFSKTQKFDFKDQMKNIFQYMPPGSNYAQSSRRAEQIDKYSKVSPMRDIKQPRVKSKKVPSGGGSSRRSRGSQSKGSNYSGVSQNLNKSAVLLSSYTTQQSKKKDTSKSFLQMNTHRTREQSGDKNATPGTIPKTAKFSEMLELSPSTEDRMRKAFH